MARYVTDRGYEEDFLYPETGRDPGNREVSMNEPRWSGLLDARGNKLFKAPNPIGFGRHE